MSVHHPEIVRALAAGIRPRLMPKFDVWADANVLVRREGRQVPWRTSTTPYLREIMQVLSADDPTEEVVIIKPSQWGASEMLNAFCAYVLAERPTPILFLQPDLDAARRYSLSRLGPVLDDCRALDGLLVEAKSREAGNTLHTKSTVDGVTLDILGGNSPTGMASKPAGVVLIDEWDRMAVGAGVGDRAEGDQYELAKNRTITFVRWRKIVAASTPGNLSTSKIEPAYLASDRRRWWVPCALCSARIVLEFDQLWWPGEDISRVVYRCQRCDRAFDERHKRDIMQAGQWIPDAPGRRVRGYASSGLVSPWLSWADIADRWQRAQGKPGKMRVFVNNVLGQTYDLHGETRVAPHQLAPLRVTLAQRDGFPIVPARAGVLTAGVDVQHDRLEVSVFAWGRGEECWHLHQVILHGDPSADVLWSDLDTLLRRPWTHAGGAVLTLQAACIDTGYMTQRVLDFVRTRQARGVWGVKGSRGEGRRVWPKRPSKAAYRKAEFYLVASDTAKAHIYARLRASAEARVRGELGGRGQIHIARHVGDDAYLEQLVAEVPETQTIHGHPRIVWKLPEHKRNEALDCAVYGYAALLGWQSRGRRLDAAVAGLGDVVDVEPVAEVAPAVDGKRISSSESTSPNSDEMQRGSVAVPVATRQAARPASESRPARKIAAPYMAPR